MGKHCNSLQIRFCVCVCLGKIFVLCYLLMCYTKQADKILKNNNVCWYRIIELALILDLLCVIWGKVENLLNSQISHWLLP